jgi:hypothetical protein
MTARRARIDSTLDRLQARLTETRGRAQQTAMVVAAAGGVCLVTLSWLRRRMHRRRLAADAFRPSRRLVS